MLKPTTSIAMSISNKIYLIGFMASGKTTLAKKLSKHLGYSFVDTDKTIESNEENTIESIFKNLGEQYFRNLETEILHKVTNNSNKVVVSTGGGMACNQSNLDYMLANGTVVFLKLDLKSIKSRLKASKTKRPLVDKLTDEEFNETIDNLYNDRIPFYEQAHLTINALNIRSLSMNKLEQQLKII